MILTSTGKTGAGKTWWVVKQIYDKYFDRGSRSDSEDGPVYSVKSEFVIYSNISGFCRHSGVIDLEKAVGHAGGIAKFFNEPFQRQLTEYHKQEGKSIIYAIDEAQSFFRKFLRDQDVFLYFEKHRHMGHMIYMTTQHISKLPKDLRDLIHYEVWAVQRGLSLPGTFIYNKFSDGQRSGSPEVYSLWKNREIFNLYKSQDQFEPEKFRNPFLKIALVLIVLCCFSLYYFLHSLGVFRDKEQRTDVASAPSSVSSSVPSSASGPSTSAFPAVPSRGQAEIHGPAFTDNLDPVSPRSADGSKLKVWLSEQYLDGKRYVRYKVPVVTFFSDISRIIYLYNPVLQQFQTLEQCAGFYEVVQSFTGPEYYFFVPESYVNTADSSRLQNRTSGYPAVSAPIPLLRERDRSGDSGRIREDYDT